MDLKLIHDHIEFILRKERLGFQTHAEYDAVLDRSQMQVFADYFSAYGVSQKVHDALNPFKTSYQFTNRTSPSGVITMPADYIHLLNVYTSGYNNDRAQGVTYPVRFVNEDELVSALSSQLRPVTVSNPIGLAAANTVQLYPKKPQAGMVNYLRRPAAPHYAYILDGRKVTYDAGASTQMEWNDVYLDKVIGKALEYLGVNLNDSNIVQFGEAKDKQTA